MFRKRDRRKTSATEALEVRELMSGQPVASLSADGVLSISGSNGSDNIWVVRGNNGTTVVGDDDDVVIAGRTLSDGNSGGLSALLGGWQVASSHETRIAALRAGVGSPKVQLIRRTSVVNDAGQNDNLSGGAGRDWFFKAVDDVITDLFSEELRDTL